MAKFELIVNGKPKPWEKDTISYSEAVDLAFPSHQSNELFSVSYSHGPKKNPKGTLVSGQSVEVKSGMNFNVTPTVKS